MEISIVTFNLISAVLAGAVAGIITSFVFNYFQSHKRANKAKEILTLEFKDVYEFIVFVNKTLEKDEKGEVKARVFDKKPIDVLPPVFPVFLANTVELGGAILDMSAKECNEIHRLNHDIQEFGKMVKKRLSEASEIEHENQIVYVLETEPIRILFNNISKAFEEIEQRQWYKKYSKKLEKEQNKK